jgi:ATP-dependent Zn proteases
VRSQLTLQDVGGREAILTVHARNLKLEDELDLKWIARGTPGFSGAELANLMNEAAIAATRDGSEAVGRKHVEYARDRILMGAERQGFMMDEEERYATAVHEAVTWRLAWPLRTVIRYTRSQSFRAGELGCYSVIA